MVCIINEKRLARYARHLRQEERCEGTIEKYLRDIRAFNGWLEGREINKEAAVAWKKHLQEEHYAFSTINSMLTSLNGFFRFMKWENYRVKPLKIQRRVFRDQTRDLSREDYDRLVAAAKDGGRARLALVIETMGATGIRVSEVTYITVEAARRRRAEISMKRKVRIILLPKKLCKKLLEYAQKNKIVSGEIFLTRNGKSLSRKQIWAEMKSLCRSAGVEPTKVFPHNLRHLFAVVFYGNCKDVEMLADLLGHTSIQTTRIYLLTPGAEHARQLERLGLVS